MKNIPSKLRSFDGRDADPFLAPTRLPQTTVRGGAVAHVVRTASTRDETRRTGEGVRTLRKQLFPPGEAKKGEVIVHHAGLQLPSLLFPICCPIGSLFGWEASGYLGGLTKQTNTSRGSPHPRFFWEVPRIPLRVQTIGSGPQGSSSCC